MLPLLILGFVSAVTPIDRERDAARILQGVAKLAPAGTPGSVCAFGPEAFPVLVGAAGGDARSAVVAATSFGSGRVVAFGHDGYLSAGALDPADGWKLFENAVRWCAKQEKGRVHVAVLGSKPFAEAITQHGLEATAIESVADLERTPRPDVACFMLRDFSEAERTTLTRWVKSGGGLVVGDTGWGWEQLHPGKTLTNDHTGNLLLAPMGLMIGSGTPGATEAGSYSAAESRDLVQALDALAALEAASAKNATPLTAVASARTASILMEAALLVPTDDKLFRPRLARLVATREPAFPTEKAPLSTAQPLDRVLVALACDEGLRRGAQEVKAHPASASFPGPVPSSAPRVVRVVVVDAAVPRWHGTGLYAAAGEVVEITLPKDLVSKGWAAHIGCHTDDLSGNDKWSRMPRIVRHTRLDAELTRIASPFGGLVYVDVPNGSTTGIIKLTLRGAVEAPRFVLGETSAAEWKGKIRAFPAPWAELETRKVVFSVPTSVAREIDDPTEILQYWDRVMDACADLAAIQRDRPSPERFVSDVQISAGYMHSGYPIMTFLDAPPFLTNIEKLKEHGWGPFHEMGHNHQQGTWTFEGTGEVTNNLFTLYVFDKVVGARPSENRDFDDAQRAKRWKDFVASGRKFETWKGDPFLALCTYMDLQDAFGWELFERVFAQYHTMKESERPKSDAEKRDQWLITVSRACGRDLGPFLQAWSVPTGDVARALVSALPAWMPDHMKP